MKNKESRLSKDKEQKPVDKSINRLPQDKSPNESDSQNPGKNRFADPSDEDKIRQKAYELAEKRGFIPGYEWEDWFTAQKLVKGQ